MISSKERLALYLIELKRLKLVHQFDLRRFCFPKQLAFIEDKARFKTAVCSRRAGKTVGCAADLTDTALKHPGVVCLYITLSRINAKRIIWPELVRINREYNLGGKTNETLLSLTYPNGSVIYASGAKDKREIENFRGLPIKKVYVDEVASFRSHIQELIDDVLSKALFDHNGTLCLIGTPGPVPTGYFYECSQSKNWSHHAWTMFDNPWLEKKSGKAVQELIHEDCERMGVDLLHPKIQRESFGKWVMDPDSLVFKYDKERNDYQILPELPGEWSYVIGVDLGFDDSDAIAVIGWHEKIKEAYLVEELVTPKQGITELARSLEDFYKRYNPLKIVMDTGGLGKKISEEIQKRYSIPIQAAEKVRKFEYIELLNDAMRTKKFYAKSTSRFAQDCFLVEWDKESVNPKISDNYHSDVCFVGGTNIATRGGPKCIESIQVGDLVLTRLGYKTVTASSMTNPLAEVLDLLFSNGSILKCTPGHKIFTKNRGYVRADSLLYSDRFVSYQECRNQQQLNLNVLNSTDTQIQSTHPIEFIIMATLEIKKCIFTERFGKIAMDLFRKGTTSIIKIETPLITIFRILSACLQQTTIRNTKKIVDVTDETKSSRGTWKKSGTWRKYGMPLQKVWNGIVNMQSTSGRKTDVLLRQFAQYVLNPIKGILSLPPQFFIVQTDVVPQQGGLQVWMTSPDSANIAGNPSKKTNIPKSDFAVDLVGRRYQIKKEPVYNITVAGEHEYFANEILVKNCDAGLYAFRESLHWLYEAEGPRVEHNSVEWFRQQEEAMERALQSELRGEQEDDLWGDFNT